MAEGKRKKKENKNAGTIRYINEVVGRTKWNILALCSLRAIGSLFSVSYALFFRSIVNAAVDGDRDGLWTAILGFVAVVAVHLSIQVANRYLRARTSTTLEIRLKTRLYSQLLSRDYGSVSAIHSGEWMNRLTSDTGSLAGGLTRFLPNVVGMFVRLFSAVSLIVAMEPRFLFVIVPVLLAALLVSVPFRSFLQQLQRNIRETEGKVRIFLQETLESMLVVRSFGVEKDMTEQAEKKMEVNRKARMKRANFSNFCDFGYGVLMNGAYLLAVVFCGYGILNGTMSYGNFTAMLQLIGQVEGPISNISGLLPSYYSMMVSAERLREAELMPEPDEEEIWSPSLILERYRKDFKGIGLANASFTYLPPVQEEKVQMPVTVHDVNLEIEKGEFAAFVGPSGCGKSTVQKLMMCLYPLDGGEQYVLTEAGPEPLTAKWRRLFAYVPQENQLMSGTIREIVSFSDRDEMQDDERIWRSLKIACADEFVLKLENGLDTQLGERGSGLSEGQMQRLAIARAIFSDHPILMLDECTSALDMETEGRLLRRLREMTDHTVIIVTHRTAALEICDKIVTFSPDGRIVSEKKKGKENDSAGT